MANTEWLLSIEHRKWRETKQQPIILPGPAVPGCCLVSLHFLCYILCSRSVRSEYVWLSGLSEKTLPQIVWIPVGERNCWNSQREGKGLDNFRGFSSKCRVNEQVWGGRSIAHGR